MRPPLGTRWGDLTPEQREAFPVGATLGPVPGVPSSEPLTLTGSGWAFAFDVRRYPEAHPDRTIASYPDGPAEVPAADPALVAAGALAEAVAVYLDDILHATNREGVVSALAAYRAARPTEKR